MITTLDRMFLVSYFRSYAIVWTSLIGLYVVLDLFTPLDDFMNKPGGFAASAEHIITYYGYRIPQLFDLMAEPITLMAAAFSVSWMQRNNELLPQLSAGIPTRRAIRPILLHCKAGLHRTGRLTAIYRIEFHGWSPGEALRELRANGYGYVAASEADDFVVQFIQNYKPRWKIEGKE